MEDGQEAKLCRLFLVSVNDERHADVAEKCLGLGPRLRRRDDGDSESEDIL